MGGKKTSSLPTTFEVCCSPSLSPPLGRRSPLCCPLPVRRCPPLKLSSRYPRRGRLCSRDKPLARLLSSPLLFRRRSPTDASERRAAPRAASKNLTKEKKLLTFCANRSAAEVFKPVVITAVTTGRLLAASEYQWPVATNGLASERANDDIFLVFRFFSTLSSRKKERGVLSSSRSFSLP